MDNPLSPETPDLIERLKRGDHKAIAWWQARREEKLLGLAKKIRGRHSL
jgi:hypothetical protein